MIRTNPIHRIFLLSLLSATLFAAAGPARAERSESFVREITAALDIHDKAQSVGEEIRALEAFRTLTERYSDEWLPPYWTAYLATQVARLKGRTDDFPEDLDPKALVREAHERFEQAKRRAGKADDLLASDLAMLEGFVYNFHEFIVAESDEEKEKWKEKRRAAYHRALTLNPRNPLMYVLIGTGFFREDRPRDEVIAGIALLDHAEQIYDRAPNRALTTYWNKDFIPFWRARGEKRLAELLAEDGSSTADD